MPPAERRRLHGVLLFLAAEASRALRDRLPLAAPLCDRLEARILAEAARLDAEAAAELMTTLDVYAFVADARAAGRYADRRGGRAN